MAGFEDKKIVVMNFVFVTDLASYLPVHAI